MTESIQHRESFMQRLGGIAVEIVGPALVMLIVGSLAFFLIEVFYRGPYDGRAKWTFGLFTFAAVLISRISIELGKDRATVYGLALAAATLLVANRYMQSSSMFGLGGFIGNAVMLAIIWWCAARLTWDCTFIDHTRDATGQGMLDLAIDRIHRFRDGEAPGHEAADQSATSGAPDSEDQSGPQRNAIVELLFRRRQPNTPGLWVFYFLIAGLPIFGIGQIFLGMSNVQGHRNAAIDFAIYMLAALCLLMMTSITGLHRYLSKQQAALPSQVAKRWMVFGTLLALAIVFLTFWLPRPTPEYAISSWLPKLTSPDLQPSQISFGRDGQRQSDNNTNIESGPGSSQPRRESSGGSSGSGRGQSEQSQNSASGQGSQNNPDSRAQRNGESGSGGGQHDQGEQDNSGSSSKSGGQQSGKSSGQQQSNQQHQGNQGSESGNQRENNSNDSNAPSESENSNDSGTGDKSSQQASEDSERQSELSRNPNRNGNRSRNSDRQNRSGGSSRSSDNPPPQSSQSNEQQDDRDSGAGNSSANQNNASNPAGQIFGALGSLLRFLMFLIVVAILLFFAFKYRAQLLPAIRSFLDEMAEFWRRLFGGKPKSKQELEAPPPKDRKKERYRGFHQFKDPFASGKANKWSTEQLIQYTFAAMEAWARDHQRPRHEDQTPHEFVKSATQGHNAIAEPARYLADLYCELAYADHQVPRKAAMMLAGVWEQMRNLSPARAPTPAFAN